MNNITAYLYKFFSVIRNRLTFVDQWKYHWNFSKNIRELGFTKSAVTGGYYLTGKPGKIFIRSKSSDERVFWQIFIDREYKPVVDILQLNGIEVKYIIDAGANIGLTSLVFSEAFPTATIISIEPDEGNFSSLEKNTKGLRITALKKAIWNSITELELDRSFRDGEAWSVQVKEPQRNNQRASLTPTTTFREIMENNNWEHIDLLKVDIEGAERFIFDEQYDTGFLSKTRCIALEIHDEYGIRNKIYELLVSRHFFLFEEGELTIGINQKLLANHTTQ